MGSNSASVGFLVHLCTVIVEFDVGRFGGLARGLGAGFADCSSSRSFSCLDSLEGKQPMIGIGLCGCFVIRCIVIGIPFLVGGLIGYK